MRELSPAATERHPREKREILESGVTGVVGTRPGDGRTDGGLN